jgi:uncharacterized protein with PQ loop repeat
MSMEVIGYIAATLTCIGYLLQISIQLKSGDMRYISLPGKSVILCASLLWIFYGLHVEQKAIVVVGSVFLSITIPTLFLKIQSHIKEQNHKKKFPPIQSRYESLRRDK